MKAPKTVFVCSECDYQSPKWMGCCPECGSWNTFREETYSPTASGAVPAARKISGERAVRFSEMEETDASRFSTGIGEFDRVLGGGLVKGSVVLLAGEPGIGKSTLLMQFCSKVAASQTVLYVSGEESKAQLKLRATRLGADGGGLLVLTETDLDTILSEHERLKPDIMIVDSIQTLYSQKTTSSPGSIAQVRECTNLLINRAKTCGSSVVIVGHVNKEGGIAGPKVLEHMVDAVLSFEGDRTQAHRIIRAAKNRYGSTNEIGVFEMTDTGLCEVENPSAMLLAGRPKNVSGSCAVCVMEGTRPIIAEIQALVTPTTFPSPKRTAGGIDYNRMCLLLAVLEKRLGLRFSACDVYLNVVGGLRLDEPAVDAAICLALISSLRDIPVPDDLIAMGEIGLGGEFRAITYADLRVKEATRLGFTKIALPKRTGQKTPLDTGAELKWLSSIFDAIRLFGGQKEEK